MRIIFALMAGAILLAGCASYPVYPAPAVYGARTRSPAPPGPNLYLSAPRASLHSELMACGGYGSNIGPLGPRRESLVYTPYIQTVAGQLLREPVEQGCLSSGFGWRGSDTGGGRAHTGLDLAHASGGYVYAAGDGRIASVGWRNGYGLVLEIDHGAGVRTLYAHLNEVDPALRQGARVVQGQPVARMGNTGNATGVHLHYEVIVDGLQVDPLTYGGPAQIYVTTPVVSQAGNVPLCDPNAAYDPRAPCEAEAAMDKSAAP